MTLPLGTTVAQGTVMPQTPAAGLPSASFTPPSASITPPSLSLGPSIGGTLGVSQLLEGTLAPGQVSTVQTTTSALDDKTAFPYHISFNNAPLNIAQCASPVSAVPYVSATISTASGTVQTTGYGQQFTF